MRLKRAILVATLSMMVLTAGIGVVSVFANSYRFYDSGLFAVMLASSLYCLLALAIAYIRERGLWRKAMFVALVLCLLGLIGAIGYMGIEEYRYSYYRRSTSRWMYLALRWTLIISFMASLWALTLPVLACVSAPKFTGWARWVKALAVLLLVCTAVFGCGWYVAGAFRWVDHQRDELFMKILTALLLPALCAVLSLPFIYKLKKMDVQEKIVSTQLDVCITCPRCKHMQTIHTGHSRCAQCRLKFNLQIEEPCCPGCGYLLHNLTRPVCPECGAGLSEAEVPPDEPADALSAAGDA